MNFLDRLIFTPVSSSVLSAATFRLCSTLEPAARPGRVLLLDWESRTNLCQKLHRSVGVYSYGHMKTEMLPEPLSATRGKDLKPEFTCSRFSFSLVESIQK